MLIDQFISYIEAEKRFSPLTANAYLHDMEQFAVFLNDKYGLELSINEIPNFDVFVTRCELSNAIDKAIQTATESNNSRELLILQRIKT